VLLLGYHVLGAPTCTDSPRWSTVPQATHLLGRPCCSARPGKYQSSTGCYNGVCGRLVNGPLKRTTQWAPSLMNSRGGPGIVGGSQCISSGVVHLVIAHCAGLYPSTRRCCPLSGGSASLVHVEKGSFLTETKPLWAGSGPSPLLARCVLARP
jgi:hypothetical protein